MAVLAFVRVSSAIRINEKSAFIDGNFDSDNTYMQDIVMHEKKEIDDARQFKLNKAQSIA